MAGIEEQKHPNTAGLAAGRGEALIDLASSAVLGLGLILLVSPLFFYWFIHGDSDRYVWIIDGPSPFDQFGGGPYQLFVLGVSPIVTGLALIVFGSGVRRRLRRHVEPAGGFHDSGN